MDKKIFVIALCVLVLFTINLCAAQDTDNSTGVGDDSDLLQTDVNEAVLEESSSPVNTHIDIESNTTFDVVGDHFKIKLSDDKNKSVANRNVTFTIKNVTYAKTTDSKGIASLKINLADGKYKVITDFAGDSRYGSSSKTTTILVNNTRIVEAGMSNAQIQQIIDNAKPNNIILFVGDVYEDVNLVINKRLTLLSKVNTVLKSSSDSPVITIKGKDSSHTTIKGFVIKSNEGISIHDSDYVTIAKNEITTGNDAITAKDVKYLNITKNDIVKNNGNGIVLVKGENSYITDNDISDNKGNGIVISKSNNTYIYSNKINGNGKNGILATDKVGKTDYGSGPENLFIGKNTINKNRNGIYLDVAGNNIRITKNEINKNIDDGLALNDVGSNTIQSNVIHSNYGAGIEFLEHYVRPKGQDISYNVIYGAHKEVEARDTYYEESGERLKLGDNWYTDNNIICPKINTKNIRFSIKQVGENTFLATFVDSKGNVASLLPDRELTVQVNNGEKITFTVSGGTAIFQANAKNGDDIKATVDNSDRLAIYDGNNQDTYVPQDNSPSDTADYPSIEYDDLYDMGSGGTGQGTGTAGNGSGEGHTRSNQNSQSDGNSSSSQSQEPTSNPSNPINDVSQTSEVSDSPAASDAGSAAGQSSSGQSVVKQIIIDDDEFFKVTGISFIVLLIILTIGFYYREDIMEMKSKR